MGKTLVVIGEHNEEIRFGDYLRAYIEAISNPGVVLHRVENSYSNGSNDIEPRKEEIRVAEEEIFGVMSDHRPDVTISVHTGERKNGMCIAELIALHEYERLQPIRTAECLYPVDDCWTIWIEKFKNVTRDSGLQTQKEFPFLALEVWLDPTKDKPPYEKEVAFASHVINQVSGLYSLHKFIN